MGKKGKGRQAGGFGSKNLRAAHTLEWQNQVHQIVVERNPLSSQPNRHVGANGTRSVHDKTLSTTIQQRPRLTRLGQLKGILRERQFQESYELLERRRRAGFVPSISNGTVSTGSAEPINPPGWMLQYGKDSSSDKTICNDSQQAQPASSLSSSTIESLQSKCLRVLCQYILEYLEVMGKDELHTALALLPAETLAKLSVAVSKRLGMTDDLVYAIGKHAHVEELSLRSKLGMGMGKVVTDQGLLQLIPRLPSKSRHQHGDDDGQQYLKQEEEDVLDDWEIAYDDDNDDDVTTRHGLVVDSLHLDGVSVGLKRLELIDCLDISADAALALLEKCACITHLSLAGSFHRIEDGVQVMSALPDLLPGLRVLDVTRCNWMNPAILSDFEERYRCTSRGEAPSVYCQGYLFPKGQRPGNTTHHLHDW